MRNSLHQLLTRTLLLLLVLSLTGCGYFAKNTQFLTDRDKVYIVEKGTQVNVLWDNEKTSIVTDFDMILLDKGTYLRLEREANITIGG